MTCAGRWFSPGALLLTNNVTVNLSCLVSNWKRYFFQVLSFSTLNETVCRCPRGSGTFFASSFVTPNLIDFNTVFSKFDASNAAVYGTMIGIIFLYILGVIYLRRKDKTDNIKVKVNYFMTIVH